MSVCFCSDCLGKTICVVGFPFQICNLVFKFKKFYKKITSFCVDFRFSKESQSCLLTQKTNGQNQICYVNFPTKFMSEKQKNTRKKWTN